MSAIGKLLSLTLDLATKLIKLLKRLTWKALAGLAVVVMLVAAGFIGYVIGSNEGTPPEPPTTAPPTTAPPPPVTLGGVDLNGYCQSLDFPAIRGDEDCTHEIDLDFACDWQYLSSGHTFVFEEEGNPLSGVCYNSEGEAVGGIQNMRGFCQHMHPKGGDSTTAIHDGSAVWFCYKKIDHHAACVEQHDPHTVVEARKENGLWACYGYRS